MRELIMWNLMTLDGYFEGPRAWDLEFHEYAWGEELRRFSLEQEREVGAHRKQAAPRAACSRRTGCWRL